MPRLIRRRFALLLPLVLALVPTSAITVAMPIDVTVTVDRATPDGISRLATGVTHAQHSLDPWGDPGAVARGKALLSSAVRYQNQHLMGWGAGNPEPAPGVYDWKSLDRRIQLMRDTGAVPVITLCCAPDWMKGGAPGTTDWSTLEVAPLPEHYADFAALARQVALRYPDVRYYQVWNELKGFWDRGSNNWDYVAYTALYNQVYDALKSVDPAIQVGSPYLIIEATGSRALGYPRGQWYTGDPLTRRNREVLTYWLRHRHGADFISIDRRIAGREDPNSYSVAERMALTRWFGDIARQIRQLPGYGGEPIWFAEDYFARVADSGDIDGRAHAAGLASTLYHQLKAGVSLSLYYKPQGQGERGDQQGLFSDTRLAGGGQPLPSYAVYQAFHDHFGPGTQLYRAASSSSDVEVLASATQLLIINKRGSPVEVRVNGVLDIGLAAYEVRVLDLAQHSEQGG